MPAGERLRLGVAGCGRVLERYHLPALRKDSDWKLVAACDPSPERRAWVARHCERVAVFDSLAALLDTTPLDAVLLTTPPDSHCPLAIEALARGLPVLVEKPMALNTSEADAVLKAMRRAQQPLWVGFNRRFFGPYLQLRTRLAAMPVESMFELHCEFSSGSPSRQPATHHLGDEARGGGVLEDIASHQIDLLPWLLDRTVVEVRAGWRTAHPGPAKSVQYELRFDTGLVAHCRASRAPTYYESIAAKLSHTTLSADSLGVFESRWLPLGYLGVYSRLRTLSGSAARKLRLRRNELTITWERQLRAFAAALRGEPPAYLAADAASGARCIAVIQACHDSLERGGCWTPVVPLKEAAA